MKANKKIRSWCVIISLISLIALILINISKISNKTYDFLYDISLGICTGALLSALTAAIAYNCQKQEKTCVLKLDIKKEIEKCLDLFYSIEYIYFEDKLSKELKALGEYEKNKEWFESFVYSHKNLLEHNIKKLKNIKKINFEKIQSNIDELSKLDKKISIKEYDYFYSQCKKIENLSRYFDINPLETNIPNVYKKIQDIIFECKNENGEKTSNDIQLKGNDIYPTEKVNLIINNLELISSKLQ